MTDGGFDQQGLHQLMIEARPRLHRFCARMVGSAIDGEDVVQEAMAKAMEALPVSGRIDRPESWLFRIAHNAAMDELRRRRRLGPQRPISMQPMSRIRWPPPMRGSRPGQVWSRFCICRLHSGLA
jgi:RNA polymerase sigma factor (sigma-70 family)